MLYIAYCTFHACPVHFIAFDAYVVPVICCTQCTIFYTNNNRVQLLTRSLDGSYLSTIVVQRQLWNCLYSNVAVCMLHVTWNCLRYRNCPDTFRWRVKSHYFQEAFSSLDTYSLRLRFGICAFIKFTYLLTY